MARFVVAVCLCLWVSATVLGQAPEVKPVDLTADEKEFIALCEEMSAAQSDFYTKLQKVEEAEAEKFYTDNNPAKTFVPKLATFEEKHRGTHPGLMAARRLVLLGVGGGLPDNAGDLGRREVLKVLHAYAAFDELPEILRYLDSGNAEPGVEPCLRSIIASSTSTEQNRLFAEYMLANWSVAMRRGREYMEQRLQELKDGGKPNYPHEAEGLARRMKKMIPHETLAGFESEAAAILTQLSQSSSEARLPAVKGVDPQYHIIRVDADATKTRPLIKELASGVLFQEKHLRAGKPAPELNLQLVGDKSWSLADQKGKCVIIQFSFKGCGPCEEMYPDLRELAKQFPDKLSIVSILADEKRADTIEAVETGKITWNAHWDGFRGPIGTKWAVTGFPTVYVVDREGKVVADVGRGEQMKARIGELCK